MSHTQQPKQSNGIVTSDVVRSKRRFSSRGKLVGILVVLLVLITVTVLYGLHEHKTPPKQKNAVVTNTQQLLLHPDQAVAAYQNELTSAQTPLAKSTAYYDLGTAYMNAGKPVQAISVFQTALKEASSSPTSPYEVMDFMDLLAHAYAAAGQRDQAVSTLQKLVVLLQQSTDPIAHNQVPTYQAKIQTLQSGGTI